MDDLNGRHVLQRCIPEQGGNVIKTASEVILKLPSSSSCSTVRLSLTVVYICTLAQHAADDAVLGELLIHRSPP